MALNVPELEQRLSNLQSQVERLWRHTTEQNVPLEQRLSGMADEYAKFLKQWTSTVERHARAVTQLEAYIGEWKDASGRIQQDSSHRLEDLEAVIEREWTALRTIHEQPVKELREHTASLTAICIATASAAQQGFDRTESRLASFEGDFHQALNELTRELRTVVAEIRTRPDHPSAHLESASPWALDDVARLHSQLRTSNGVEGPAVNALQVRERPALPGSGSSEFVQADSPSGPDEGVLFGATDLGRKQPIPWNWRVAIAGVGLAVIVVGVFGWRLYDQVRVSAQQVQQAELESAKAAALAAREAGAAREEAAREIANAREMATRAQTISNVLAAPDLVRFNLGGIGAAPRASGQALWSRSRGLVFSGTGIPPAPPNGHHQVWLLTRVGPVKAGTFGPEVDGTVTSVQPAPVVPRAVIGVMVTVEGASGGETPSGDAVLTSVQSVE